MGTVKESATGVRITMTVEDEVGEGVVCPAFARLALRFPVALRAPLAGRRIEEASAATMHNGRIPRMIGLAPVDAGKIALSTSLRERTRRVRAHVPRPVVRAQFPAPGAPIPHGRVLRLEIEVPW